MSYLLDVEKEAIEEEEELIEAVEQIVEKAAEAIYTDLKKDVSGFYERLTGVYNTFLYLFPFVVYWRDDPATFWADMEKMSVAFCVFVACFWILAPSPSRWGEQKTTKRKGSFGVTSWFQQRNSGNNHNNKRSHHQGSSSKKTALDRLESSLRSAFGSDASHRGRPSIRRACSFSSIDPNKPLEPFSALSNEEEADEDGVEEDEDEDREDTEEEKFAKRWPALLETRYCFLVLPPNCRRVEKPKHAPRASAVAAAEKTSQVDNNANKRHDNSDEENPAQRLRNYGRQFLHLLMSFLRYDYVGAGWTLIHWMEACWRSRKKNQPLQEEDDDESDAGSVRSLSISSVASTTKMGNIHKNNNNLKQYRKVRTPTRSKRDSLKMPQAEVGDTFNIPFEDQEEKETEEPSNDTADPGSRNSLTITEDDSLPLRKSVTVDDDEHDEAEEKKDSSTGDSTGMRTPPQTPKGSHSRTNSSSSVYATPDRDYFKTDTDPGGGGGVGEAVANKLATHAHNLLLESSSKKTKDALASYRTRHPAAVTGKNRYPLSPIQTATPRTQKHLIPENSAATEPPNLLQQQSGAFYFETASTQEHLRKMNLEVPVPDKNGYVLGDEFLPDNNWTPLLVFVNSRSGPQQGHLLVTQLRGLLNPLQIWDLSDGPPEEVLESFSTFTRLRILVCGGDGTVSWIVSSIEKMKLQRWPPIAILPLGTGNDLARIHGWGGGYNNESLEGILEQVTESYISWLDRWEMTIENKKGKVKGVKSFFNYLGVGADAQTAMQVHLLRETRPQLFFSRLVNMAWYAIFGAEHQITSASVNLPNEITLIADGVEVPLPSDSQGIILLNIDSYAGGSPLWSSGRKGGSSQGNSPVGSRKNSFNSFGHVPMKRSKSLDAIKSLKIRPTPLSRVDSTEDIAHMALTEEEKFMKVTACERPSSCQDGFLDIVSIRGPFHLGQIRCGLGHAERLCQCRSVDIVIKRKSAVQIDGEPWRQSACTLKVKKKKDAAIMLHRSADDSNGTETEMAKLLDWAEERELIDNRVHAALMKEFSRRIESKNRQRRLFRSQDNMIFNLKRAMGSSGNLGQRGPTPTGIMF